MICPRCNRTHDGTTNDGGVTGSVCLTCTATADVDAANRRAALDRPLSPRKPRTRKAKH